MTNLPLLHNWLREESYHGNSLFLYWQAWKGVTHTRIHTISTWALGTFAFQMPLADIKITKQAEEIIHVYCWQ